MPLTLGVLLFEGFELLDVFGPLEMLGQLRDDLKIVMLAERIGPVASAQGPAAHAEAILSHTGIFDILLIPGGIGTRREVNNEQCINWIRRNAALAKYIASVCTGSALLAKAGVLDNKKATSNKVAFQWVCSQGQKTEWIAKARWVKDGNIFTSAGISAGIDMALALIETIWGRDRAEAIATWAEYYWNSDSEEDTFSGMHGLA